MTNLIAFLCIQFGLWYVAFYDVNMQYVVLVKIRLAFFLTDASIAHAASFMAGTSMEIRQMLPTFHLDAETTDTLLPVRYLDTFVNIWQATWPPYKVHASFQLRRPFNYL